MGPHKTHLQQIDADADLTEVIYASTMVSDYAIPCLTLHVMTESEKFFSLSLPLRP